MATYRQIHVKIWSSPDFQELSPYAKLVFIHLFSNSHRNEAALYRITPKTISNETDIPVEDVKTALSDMEKVGVIKYDWDNHIVWVINAVKYQKVNPNGIKAIKKNLEEINHLFAEEFKNYYADILNTSEGVREVFQNTSETLPNASETPSDKDKDKGKGKYKGKDNNNTLSNEASPALDEVLSKDIDSSISDTPSINNQTNQKQETEKENSPAPPAVAAVRRVMEHYNRRFGDIWSRPLKLTKERSEKIKARLRTFTEEELCRAIDNIRSSPFHCGENDRGQVYAAPEFIFRNDAMVDKWLNMPVRSKQTSEKGGTESCAAHQPPTRKHEKHEDNWDWVDWNKFLAN